MLTATQSFTVDADIHEAGYNCNGVCLDVPYGHAHLPSRLLRPCGLDTESLIIQSVSDNTELALVVWLDGEAEQRLEVGSIYFFDRFLRPEDAGFLPFVRLSISGQWPSAAVTVKLTEPFDLTPHAGHTTAPPLIIQLRAVDLIE